jgi:predicted phosphodiesterase
MWRYCTPMTRVAVISDIHADLPALETALRAIEREAENEGVDERWCLGDIIGRGKRPIECLERVFATCDKVFIGNHEAYQVDPDFYYNDLTFLGRRQFFPTKELLEKDERWPQWRERLRPLEPGEWDGSMLIVHASPAEPLWHHLNAVGDLELIGQQLPVGTTVVFGHTHVQSYGRFKPGSPPLLALGDELVYVAGARDIGEGIAAATGPTLDLAAGATHFVNPGAVGVSRLPGRPVEWMVLELAEDRTPVSVSWRRTPR